MEDYEFFYYARIKGSITVAARDIDTAIDDAHSQIFAELAGNPDFISFEIEDIG